MADCGFFSGWTCGGPHSCDEWKLGAWPSDGIGVDRGFCWTWIDELYYASMTFVTIGYGDVTPHSKAGKFMGALIVTLGLLVFTVFFSELFDIVQARPQSAGFRLP